MDQQRINNIVASFTGRRESMFSEDILTNKYILETSLADKSVLVIGGAGTIGSSYIHEIIKFPIRRLVVIDHNENGLAELIRQIRSKYKKPPEIITYPISFGNPIFMHILEEEGPFQVVANFAALKHVRTEKDIHAVKAMLLNNVILNYRLLEFIQHQPVEHFFCVSTDKASNPVNIMGASKKLMEDIIFSYADILKITTARFANVAFSNGSLLESYIKRFERREPIVCPKDIKRYFVSIKEAGEFCLLSSILGKSGEIFFPKLNVDFLQPFSTTLLAFFEELKISPHEVTSEDEARTACAEIENYLSQNKYPVFFFDSDTTGEKKYEEFFDVTDQIDLNRFKNIGIITRKDKHKNLLALEQLEVLLKNRDVQKTEIVAYLKELIPDFNHIEKNKFLDQKM